MKKLSIVMAIVLCVSACFCVPVSAANPEARLYVKANGTVVTVRVKTNANIGALQGAIEYDQSSIGYDSAEANVAIAANNVTESSFRNVAGATKLALVGNASSGTSGEWATVTYSAEEGTPADFAFESVKAFSVSGAKIDVTKKVIMPGDVDGDKIVTVKDYVRLKRSFSAGAQITGEAENGDVNMDGANNANSDIPRLRKDLLGL